jgi:hypothetical protein
MVKDSVWFSLESQYFNDVLCLGCLETKLGRVLSVHDIKPVPASIHSFTRYFELFKDPIQIPDFVSALSNYRRYSPPHSAWKSPRCSLSKVFDSEEFCCETQENVVCVGISPSRIKQSVGITRGPGVGLFSEKPSRNDILVLEDPEVLDHQISIYSQGNHRTNIQQDLIEYLFLFDNT